MEHELTHDCDYYDIGIYMHIDAFVEVPDWKLQDYKLQDKPINTIIQLNLM